MSRMRRHHREFSVTHYMHTWCKALRHRRLFSNVKSFVMFIGYPRSGHSLVAAHMTAHKNMIISHELHALNYFQLGYRKEQLFRLIRQRDRQFAGKECRNGPYKYHVPGQWQGRHEKLLVIGDKKGGGTTKLLFRNPDLLPEFRDAIGIPVRIVHVVRNPFDTITRIHLLSGQPLQKAIDRYSKLCKGTSAIVRDNPDDVLTIRHESYVASPQDQLASLSTFVGLDTSTGFLNDCAKCVFPSPNQTRREVEWKPDQVKRVMQLIGSHEFLVGYTFEEPAATRFAA